jgi:hypothetical protein
MDLGSPWTEAENALLRRLILQAIPGGIYREEPPFLWTRVAQRMRKKPLKRRIYSPEVCRDQYLTHIQPRLTAFQYSLEDRPWSEAEIYSLRTYISGALPGGLDDECMKPWSEIAEKLAEDGLVGDIPLRLCDENNVREQYVKHIGPRFVSSGQLEKIIKKLEDLDAVRLLAANSTKIDAEDANADAVEQDASRGRPLHAEDWDILPGPLLGGGQFLEQ